MAELITSFQNNKVKELLALQKPKERRKSNLFVIEGVREISLAQQGNYEINRLYICPDYYQKDSTYPINESNTEIILTSTRVFEKIAYRGTTGGIIAVAVSKKTTIHDLNVSDNPLLIILEQVEKPGNIGAVLRTADAAGVTAVIICDPSTDFYNPNVIRSSIGCLFTVPVVSTTNQALFQWLQSHQITSYAALLSSSSQSLYEQNLKKPTAFIFGAESTGLSDFWEKNADVRMIIPMRGQIDSLNVSTATSVCIYEAFRQRI